MAKIAMVALAALVFSTTGKASKVHTNGIITQAEYQKFVSQHKLEKRRDIELILTNNQDKAKRKSGSNLMIEVAPSGKNMELKIKRKEKRRDH